MTAGKIHSNVIFTPIGTVIWFAGGNAPSGYLKCNGDSVPNGSGTVQGVTSDFSALHAIVGGTIPDLRGEFIRGFDDGKGTDPGRVIRTGQTDENKAHGHGSSATATSTVTDPGHTHNNKISNSDSGDGFIEEQGNAHHGNLATDSNTTGISVSTSVSVSISQDGAAEARPRNVALLACIKY